MRRTAHLCSGLFLALVAAAAAAHTTTAQPRGAAASGPRIDVSFANVYTRFPRADGKTVWLHQDQWEGQNWKRSPGNLFGDPVKVKFNPKSTDPVRLVANRVIPPIEPPADTELVKRIRIQSAILTRWWGHPMSLGATVLLPKDYDKHPDVRYPV